jgi:hypothetical protein
MKLTVARSVREQVKPFGARRALTSRVNLSHRIEDAMHITLGQAAVVTRETPDAVQAATADPKLNASTAIASKYRER